MSDGSLCESWQKQVGAYLASDSMQELATFLRQEKAKGKIIYPPNAQLFAAFNATPFDKVKVVILGQDPYHGPGQAHGLSFSVPEGIATPPSLLNIFKELSREYGSPVPNSGNLKAWADQGVLLLNAVLSVESAKPGSHQNKGWEAFTDEVIRQLSDAARRLGIYVVGRLCPSQGKNYQSPAPLCLKGAASLAIVGLSRFYWLRAFFLG